MRPQVNRVYAWEGKGKFKTMDSKKHPNGWRHALDFEHNEKTKTLILITKTKQEFDVRKFLKNIELKGDNLTAFNVAGSTPVPMDIIYEK